MNERLLEMLPDDSLLPRDLKRSLPMALLLARESVMSKFRHILLAHNISEQQFRVLRVLAEGGPLDATVVSERACLLAPSLTRIMRTLEERGLIRRDRDSTDGRRVSLSITADGVAMIREVAPESHLVYVDIERRFGKERVEKLLDMLGELMMLKA